MNRLNTFLCLGLVAGCLLAAGEARAQVGYYRVTSSYSLPSVPYYAYRPVVMPAVQPVVAYSPVVQPAVAYAPVVQPAVTYSPVVVSQPIVAAQPVVVSRPVIVGQPIVSAPVVVRRGLFRRPVVVPTAAYYPW
jgi:hypothetical protein